MWHSIRRWLGWAMNDLLPAARNRPTGQAVHLRYEKAGLVLYDAPVPWNADAAVVEVLLRLPPAGRQKADYLLRVVVADMPAYDAFYKRLTATIALRNVTSRFAMERIKSTTAFPIDVTTRERVPAKDGNSLHNGKVREKGRVTFA